MQPAKRLGFARDGADQSADGDDQDQEAAPGPDPTGQPGGRRSRHIFSEQECLEALTRLVGLVALGIVTPAQGNSMRADLETVLRYHERAGRGDHDRTLDDDVVLNIFDRDPTVVEWLSPLLTEDQLELVMRRATRHE